MARALCLILQHVPQQLPELAAEEVTLGMDQDISPTFSTQVQLGLQLSRAVVYIWRFKCQERYRYPEQGKRKPSMRHSACTPWAKRGGAGMGPYEGGVRQGQGRGSGGISSWEPGSLDSAQACRCSRPGPPSEICYLRVSQSQ